MEWTKVTTEEQLLEAKAIRRKVFIEEQGVAEELEHDEYDALTPLCTHILVLDQQQAVGTGRLRTVDGAGKLERICTLQEARGKGVGALIVEALEAVAAENGISKVKLGAQLQAKAFYEKLGYETASGIFIDAGIEHVMMDKKLSGQPAQPAESAESKL